MVGMNLVVRFLVEVLGVAALGYAGFQIPDGTAIKVVAMIGAPLAFIAGWALIVAPKAANGLSQPVKDVIGTVLLLVTALALGAIGQPLLALIFAAVIIVNAVLLFVFRRRSPAWGRSPRRQLTRRGTAPRTGR
jgi:Protein of unknown function (DUF2568)